MVNVSEQQSAHTLETVVSEPNTEIISEEPQRDVLDLAVKLLEGKGAIQDRARWAQEIANSNIPGSIELLQRVQARFSDDGVEEVVAGFQDIFSEQAGGLKITEQYKVTGEGEGVLDQIYDQQIAQVALHAQNAGVASPQVFVST